MPTINQLTKKPRSKKVRKSKSPVLLVAEMIQEPSLRRGDVAGV